MLCYIDPTHTQGREAYTFITLSPTFTKTVDTTLCPTERRHTCHLAIAAIEYQRTGYVPVNVLVLSCYSTSATDCTLFKVDGSLLLLMCRFVQRYHGLNVLFKGLVNTPLLQQILRNEFKFQVFTMCTVNEW